MSALVSFDFFDILCSHLSDMPIKSLLKIIISFLNDTQACCYQKITPNKYGKIYGIP